MRREIEARALELFLERGFDGTTMDAVAASAGTSRRTVFRYFKTKEDLLLGSMPERGHQLAAEAAALAESKGPREGLREALLDLADEFDAGLPTTRLRARLLATTPALHAALSGKHLEWRDQLTEVLTEKMRGRAATKRLRAQALVGSSLACLDAAATVWSEYEEGPTLRRQLQVALDSVNET